MSTPTPLFEQCRIPGCFLCASGEVHSPGDDVKPEPAKQCIPGCFKCASGEVHDLGNEVEEHSAYVEVEQDAKASTEEWGLDLEELLAKVEIGGDVHEAIQKAISALE